MKNAPDKQSQSYNEFWCLENEKFHSSQKFLKNHVLLLIHPRFLSSNAVLFLKYNFKIINLWQKQYFKVCNVFKKQYFKICNTVGPLFAEHPVCEMMQFAEHLKCLFVIICAFKSSLIKHVLFLHFTNSALCKYRIVKKQYFLL